MCKLTKPQIKLLIHAAEALMAGEWGEGDSADFTMSDYHTLERASETLKMRLTKRAVGLASVSEQIDKTVSPLGGVMAGSTLFRNKVHISADINANGYCPRCVSFREWKYTKKHKICKTCSLKVRLSPNKGEA